MCIRDRVTAAVPLATVTGEPTLVAPTLNWTVPVEAGLTVAMSVSGVPTNRGPVGETVRSVLVGIRVTVNEMVSEEAAYTPVLVGEKVAVSASVPTGRALVEVEAAPPLTVTGPPMGVVPTSNWTVPATPDVTAALRVTDVSNGWGLACVVVRAVVVGIRCV